ncbi:fungal-specific transcription factor domain-containing protein [Exophiala viscosa]|nr:fungal-specific transcription factor domain-containing protein [Exophiala viscosa]
MVFQKTARRRTPAEAPCPKCGRCFSRNDSLSRHMKTHVSHGNQRPVHRIIQDKFRACSGCRRAKIRCTGSLPCARCDQLKYECRYDQNRRDQKPLAGTSPSRTSPTTQVVPDLQDTLPPSATSAPMLDDQGSVLPGTVAQIEGLLSKPSNNTGDADLFHLSYPESTTSALPLGLVWDSDARTVAFDNGGDLSGGPSTYVSPTMHVLDPYSYKLPSLAGSQEAPTPSSQALSHCRYPILQYLSPFTDRDFGSSLACDLLDTYFSSAFSSRMHPTCHHIHNFILRKCDILDPVSPRQTHPALLASMLFVAALSDKALGLFSGPEERDRVCKYLSRLTYRLLNPSRYEPLVTQEDLGLSPAGVSDAGWTNDELRRVLDPQQESNGLPVAWGTDYVMALIHVSSVISGSEKKAASIRWWSIAFNLARDMKLNQEVESYVMPHTRGASLPNVTCKCSSNETEDSTGEVHREERRRTWWLLFLMDRHLALCYNRPLALLEAECRNLLLPLDDVTWQSGAQPHSHGTRADGPRCMLLPSGKGRLHGPPNTCSGLGLFGFFLPLMTITGHLLDFNRAKSDPVVAAASSSMWTVQEHRIMRRLDIYQTTLDEHTARGASQQDSDEGSAWEGQTADSADVNEDKHVAKLVHGYSSHICHVLQILVGSKWDPVCLFEDADFFTSSETFSQSMFHTMAAAECVKTVILAFDEDVSFMPYFFGIQLLHGSLLLLLVAFRLLGNSGDAVLAGLEAVIRATEACYITLPTDYQRQFRNVMRSATALAKGRRNNPSDTEKQLAFVLARYRWSRNGAGLAR